ncbi:GTP cyclohydrolase I FolE2 [Corticibacter populi]|uniref:GTP cyclohydrolase FolE2 n=1 Tax=Corticibacter populi TaxID=1550736 RepID=A0A3M6QYY8_9BURK|nr:GTP cyclohydrolase FolE2 [Corticibacter populi]RMX08236.1 GTP cyclohydrolase I FolE2 [Corticibacter populi]RZS35509.1 GTP cyclohydrolase I [Corticibacter populi]
MTVSLPDISLTETSPTLSPLRWVGMQGIDLPLTVSEPGYRRELHARGDVQVDLPAPHIKGIHMSRLYRLLDDLGDGEALSPVGLRRCLQAIVESHRDCNTSSARMRLQFDLLARRQALVTKGLAGWKSYPVRLDATLRPGSFSKQGFFTLRAQVTVGYSSTCPCSAALTRQLIEQGFTRAFAGQPSVEVSEVADWLRRHATLATPHSQRSEAVVGVDVAAGAPDMGLLTLIDRIEQAVGTPVQTAVKRADEQAFAALNGQNLMFVEDAVRRIQAALTVGYAQPLVHVRHLESLHPHDAVAWAAPAAEGVLA